jgi:hypothetical protein
MASTPEVAVCALMSAFTGCGRETALTFGRKLTISQPEPFERAYKLCSLVPTFEPVRDRLSCALGTHSGASCLLSCSR